MLEQLARGHCEEHKDLRRLKLSWRDGGTIPLTAMDLVEKHEVVE